MSKGKLAAALFLVVVALAWVLTGCKQASPKVIERIVSKEVPVEVTRVVEKVVVKEVPKAAPAATVTPTLSLQVPNSVAWISSGHADTKAEAFRHWDATAPVSVPTTCARCHTSYGYLDYLGADGSKPGVVDANAKVDSVVSCITCHNDGVSKIVSVTFPSGIGLSGLGPEARCMVCHQGRASTVQVDASIKSAKLADDDTVSKDLGFTNIHYFAAGATLYGNQVKGGYQYAGKAYDSKFTHVNGYDTCVECHDPHSLQVRVDACKTCHTSVKTVADLRNVRMAGSREDYNGDGDIKQGVYAEIEGLRTLLYQAMQAYAKEVSKSAIAYDGATNPYFFVDKNGNGKVDKEEAVSDNRFASWTGRLAKAAYNYQTSVKDPGAYAHNGKYIIELLYDSAADLNTKLTAKVDLSKAQRNDAGHFAGTEEAFRHWDVDGAVPGTCARCHSSGGLAQYVKEGANVSQPTSNGMLCTTCHDSLTKFTRYAVAKVNFPSGTSVDSGNPNTNLCMTCHQGRESTTSLNKLITGLEDDKVSDKLRFLNVHYFAAGATLFGTDAKGAYEYTGKTYVGRNQHVPTLANCTDCHNAHTQAVKTDACSGCHAIVKGEADLSKIRMAPVDYDGDGNVTEGMADEVAHMREATYAAMQAYATKVSGAGIVYSDSAYPYFFVDKNANGKLDAEEAVAANQFNAWTPRLLKAAYDYQYVTKDPGAFAHNPKYIIQVLYDTLESLSKSATVNMTAKVRP